jgi:hypothetical protein
MNKFLIIRILGNDLEGLHGSNQTLTNLKFTLEHEPNFENVDKIYLLNRIYDTKKLNIIKNLLKEYNFKYIEIPFKIEEFMSIKYDPRIKNINLDKIHVRKNKRDMNKLLYNFNQYVINNNGSRNFCIDYGKKNGYEWVFPFDSNAYLTQNYFDIIIKNLKKDTRYIVIPQIRLKDGGLVNEDILSESNEYKVDNLKIQEPQVAFNINSRLKFNDKLSYGCCPKAEFLRVIKVPGRWNKWYDNIDYLGIPDRPKKNVKYQILSKIIRLNPQEMKNGSNSNKRIIGLLNLVNKIRKKNMIIEGFKNNKEDKINILLILLLILFFIIFLK